MSGHSWNRKLGRTLHFSEQSYWWHLPVALAQICPLRRWIGQTTGASYGTDQCGLPPPSVLVLGHFNHSVRNPTETILGTNGNLLDEYWNVLTQLKKKGVSRSIEIRDLNDLRGFSTLVSTSFLSFVTKGFKKWLLRTLKPHILALIISKEWPLVLTSQGSKIPGKDSDWFSLVRCSSLDVLKLRVIENQ